MNIYYEKFINFFKEHNMYNEEMFAYLRNNSTMFDYRDEEKRKTIGCYYALDSKDRLKKIALVVPFIDSDKTVLINIHEYAHGITAYPKLEKKYKHTLDREIVPMLLERIYAENNPELLTYIEELNKSIIESERKDYKIALKVVDELYDDYKKSYRSKRMNSINNKCKKLVRKHKESK